MILDFIEVSSDDDDDVAREEHAVRGQVHSVQVRGEYVDLTAEGIFEAPHDVCGLGDAAQNTITQWRGFNSKDGQGEVAQCKQEFVADKGQGGSAHSATTPQMLESIADDEPGSAYHCTTTPQRQGSTADRQSDAVQCTITLQRLESLADNGQGGAAHSTITSQMLETIPDDGQDGAYHGTATPQRVTSTAHGHGDAVQCRITLQRLESLADNGQGGAAHSAITPQMLEYNPHDGQGGAYQCTTTPQRQGSSADGQGDAAHCTTTPQMLKCISDDRQCDTSHCTATLQSLESLVAHRQGNTDQCTNISHNQDLQAAMGRSAQNGSAADATTTLSGTQQETYRTISPINLPPGSTAPPFPRQFWKAGEYRLAPRVDINGGKNRLRIHPKFLHSNATSHKWAFGAIAELVDNAVDEIYSGATFVKIDKIKHGPGGEYSLIIEDNGGGMNPESLRHCMSFGFSHKCSTSSIGQYGNGFKTSTMRLGADVIVFTCKHDGDKRILTLSVGLLSYTFLMRTGCNDILVPAVDYEFDTSSSTFKRIMNWGENHFLSNLSALLKWSPFSTEEELLNQVRGMNFRGTKIIVFNLWFNDEREMELDFITDEEDIMISGAKRAGGGAVAGQQGTGQWLKQMHIANRFRYSLRVYLSILYLHLPENFQIILCGRVVEPHHIANDLIYRECIRYRPQVNDIVEVDVYTTIGFLKGAPKLDVYGFNVYHKNRLILPFWPAGSYKHQRRGIAGVLETNFIRPTHDKQDFEKTGLFHRLETRLRDMAMEYWRYHCPLVGYVSIAKSVPPSYYVSTAAGNNDQMDACPSTSINAGTMSHLAKNTPQQSKTEPCKRRKSAAEISWRAQKRHKSFVHQSGSDDITEITEEHVRVIVEQNAKLKSECTELEVAEQQLISKADALRKELDLWKNKCMGLINELQSWDRRGTALQ